MGRHSVADVDDIDDAASSAPTAGPNRGRHSLPEDDQPPARDSELTPRRRQSGTKADLRLLRQNGAVRAQCLAAVLVPFLLYTLAVVVVGRIDVYLVWIWIPIVLCGVLVGVVLDLGHRAVETPQPVTTSSTTGRVRSAAPGLPGYG